MANTLKLVEVTAENYGVSPCCGIKNRGHKGHIRKSAWIRDYIKKGFRARIIYTADNQQNGYIEYLPGRHAWRGVEAEDYMFIHCIWTFYKKYKNQGYGGLLIQACIEDARKENLKGVAVVSRKKPWLAGSELFLKNGFSVVDHALPDYQLLVKKFDPSAPDPRFKTGWNKKLAEYRRGLILIRSNQCPHSIKFADEIAETAEKKYGIPPRIVEITSSREAQNAPTPFAAFAVIFDGEILADHPISKSRFMNIMNKSLR